ncbi:MAG: hypothetical protein HYV07_26230 [Deltaproteobacteria bacterium]|nr:hypothetical protein [Deltaproteobacteria bacterium]
MARWIPALSLLFLACTEAKPKGALDATPTLPERPAPTKPAEGSGDPNLTSVKSDAQRAIDLLSAWVKPGAADPTVPWAMTHGLVGFGPGLTTSDGRSVVDYLVVEYSERTNIAGKPRTTFPPRTFANEPLEPHENIILKTLVEVGVPMDHEFSMKDGPKVTLDALIDEIAPVITVPVDEGEWRQAAWTVSLLLQAREPTFRIGADANKPATVKDLGLAAIFQLESQQRFLEDLMAAGHPEKVEKKKQGIFGHPCGGMHLIQAAVLAAAKLGDPALVARAQRQLDVMLFRYSAEKAIYEDAFRRAPEYALVLKIQELKFYGHMLETLALAAKWGVLPVTPELRASAMELTRQVVLTVAQLEPAYKDLDTIRRKQKQSYLDLIGDGCHAIRGLREVLQVVFGTP